MTLPKMLSTHFSMAEATISQTAARNGWDNTPPPEVVKNMLIGAQHMEKLRAVLGHPIILSSVYRSPRLNRAVKGAKESSHIYGWGWDWICPGFGTPLEICRKIIFSAIPFDQLIEEGTWVHISFDPRMREQVLTKDPAGGYRQGLK